MFLNDFSCQLLKTDLALVFHSFSLRERERNYIKFYFVNVQPLLSLKFHLLYFILKFSENCMQRFFFFFFSYSHFWLIQRNCIIIIICFLCSCIGWTSLPQLHILSLVFSVISFVRLVFLRPAFITPILTPWFSPSKVPSSWII